MIMADNNQPLSSNQVPANNQSAVTRDSDTTNSVTPTPTRTMASDAMRANSIESEREAASHAAIEEIRALEAALLEASEDLGEQIEEQKTPPPIEPVNVLEVPATPIANSKTQPVHQQELIIGSENAVPQPVTLQNKPIKNSIDYLQIIDDEEDEVIDTKPKQPSEDPRITALKQEVASIEKSKLEFIQKRAEYTKRENPIRREIETNKIKLQAAEESLKPFQNESLEIDERIKAMEEAERQAKTPQERHESENRRWKLEDQRHEIESKKWEAQRALEEIVATIKLKESELEGVNAEAKSTDTSIIAAENRIKELELELNLVHLNTEKETLELEWVQLNEEKRVLESDLDNTKASEAVIEEQVDRLYESATNASDATIRREYEQERRKVSLERRELEKNRWTMEQRLQTIDEKIERLKPLYQAALDNERRMYEELEKVKSHNVES